MLYRRLKRPLDFVAALGALTVLSPLVAVVAGLIRLKLGSPVLFRQKRGGWKGEPFYVLKFRSMTDERSPTGELLPDEQRLTKFGMFLRHSSIDELPGLVNVLRGEMSLVGPRPLIYEYVDRYTPQQRRRHEVRPGITGLAQVGGRNALTWEQKFELDVQYVEQYSLAMDAQIVARTVGKLIAPTDVSADGHATMPLFMGTPEPDRAAPEKSATPGA
jgi:sugar transferase EpsL